MKDRRPLCAAIFYLYAFFQGLCLIIIPAASFIFKQPLFGALSDRQYGLSFLPMNLSAVLVTVYFKRFLNYFGRQPLLAVGLGAHGVYAASLIAAAAGSVNAVVFQWLILANLALGIGFGFLISVANVAMVEMYPEKRDMALMGLHGLLGVGASLAPAAVEFFYRSGHWRESHWITLFFWAVLMVILLVLHPVSYREAAGFHEPAGFRKPRHARSSTLPRTAVFFLGAIFIYGILESITGNWCSIYLTQEKGFAYRTAARCLSAFWIFLTLGRIAAAITASRMDARFLYRGSPVVITAALTALVKVQTESAAVPIFAVIGLGCSYFFPLSISISTQYYDAWRSELSSFGIAAIMAGVFFGTTLMGFLQDTKLVRIHQTFVLAASCGAVLTGFAFLLTRKKLPRSSSRAGLDLSTLDF